MDVEMMIRGKEDVFLPSEAIAKEEDDSS